MVPDRIANMVSKSLVLLLRPQTEQDYELLLEMYHRFDSIRNLPYVLTPHITLYYYKPGMLDGDRLGAAVDYAQISPEEKMGFDFFPEGLTAQSFLDMQTYMDVPTRICFCCDGGLNRSVLAANILTHLAKKRNIPMIGYARSAFSNTQGRPVPQQVWETLEKHGIQPDKSYTFARYLEYDEVSHYSAFAAITGGAMSRFEQIHLSEKSVHRISSFFFGVRDPEYGEITHEQAFTELYSRTEKLLDVFEADYRKHIRK